jgi:hypothetical protein
VFPRYLCKAENLGSQWLKIKLKSYYWNTTLHRRGKERRIFNENNVGTTSSAFDAR